MNNELSNLVELIFDISQKIDDWEYMKIMTTIQKINAYNNNEKNEPNEWELKYYKLVKTHNALKKRNRQTAKLRKEQLEAMELTIEALQNEIQYLSQEKPSVITGNDFILV